MDLRDNIKFILEQKGMTQVELARSMGITPQNLYIVLAHNPTLAYLQRIAKALNTKVSELVAEPPLRTRRKYRDIGEPSKPTEATFICPCCGARIKATLTE